MCCNLQMVSSWGRHGFEIIRQAFLLRKQPDATQDDARDGKVWHIF